jgi:FMN phosphatase YigB (HAD superfamily)
MIRGLLIDLDDTLLENDLARFIPAYFDLLAGSLSAFGPKEQVLGAILAGTKAMIGNDDATRTLAEAFFASFRSSTGADPTTVAAVLEGFYRDVYPRLENLTRPKPGASELLRAAKSQGLVIAVATNPLMIRPAIEQRLAWAGVPVDAFEYALITDVETFHFAKPRPAYVAEALAYLGLLPGEAVMIGNDVGEDLDPAASLGLPVFNAAASATDDRASGDLMEAARWLAAQTAAESAPVHRPESLIARFEGQLAALLTRLALLDGDALRRAPAADGLAPLQVVCHLRDVDREVNLPRLKTFLAEDNPFFSSVDTDHWIEERAYLDEDPTAAIEAFAATRQEVTSALRNLDASQWQRRARHSLLGPITLADWMAVLVEHDLRHQAQVDVPLSSRRPPARLA